MIFSEEGICLNCLSELHRNEKQNLYQFYLDVLYLYLNGKMIFYDEENYEFVEEIKRLEEIGYLTSACANLSSVLIKPTGVEMFNGTITICSKRKYHNFSNYAL